MVMQSQKENINQEENCKKEKGNGKGKKMNILGPRKKKEWLSKTRQILAPKGERKRGRKPRKIFSPRRRRPLPNKRLAIKLYCHLKMVVSPRGSLPSRKLPSVDLPTPI